MSNNGFPVEKQKGMHIKYTSEAKKPKQLFALFIPACRIIKAAEKGASTKKSGYWRRDWGSKLRASVYTGIRI